MANRSLFLVMLLLGPSLEFGQTRPATPSFDVASIRRSSPDEQGGGYRFEQGGRAIITNFTVKNLIMVAWHIRDFQVIGGPPWLDTERFDIEARAEGSPSQEESRLMLRSLLVDRFGLVSHPEKRELPIYALVVAKNGPRLTAAKLGGCAPATVDFPPEPAPGQIPNCGIRQRLRRQPTGPALTQLQGIGVPLSLMAHVLGNELGRDGVDNTGITGTFDLDLQYVDSRTLVRSTPDGSPAESAGPSLFTAVEEQLGLRLESRKGPVEVVVVERVDKPSAN